ncbi:MAG: sulfatase-like hydrolase/transferase [Acidobacteria bacterium]|nr:sulfatase-like hydrolase/transferase [Acidobacteriota bacterium]
MPDLTRRSLLSAAGAAALAPAAAGRPNILFVCSDQHTSAAVGSNGHSIVKTPHLDRLAAAGVSFRNAYSGNPVCVPGRASLMTGMYASDVGSYCNSTPFDGRVPTWGNRLKDAGYQCWATGKLDLCEGKDLGFREEKTSHGHWTDPDITSLFRMPACFRPKERENADGSFEDRAAPDLDKVQRATRYLQAEVPKIKQPWCMYVGLSKPHPKFVAHSKYEQMYPPERIPLPAWPEGYLEKRHLMFQTLANFKNIQIPIPAGRVRRARAAYFGLITELDELLGSLLAELDRTGQRDNTLIVYTSDHGEMLGEHGLWLKNCLLDGANRVPLVLAGAGLPRSKTIETPVSHADLVATMLDLAGAGMAQGLRGHSLAPMTRGQAGSHPGFAFSESHSEGNCTGSFMIRKGDWKYLYFTGGEPLLFDMRQGGEFVNLARDKKHAEVRKELHGHLTSLVDPDAVTHAAFDRQEQVLKRLVRENSRSGFYDMLVGRLGPIQARLLTDRYYGTAKS